MPMEFSHPQPEDRDAEAGAAMLRLANRQLRAEVEERRRAEAELRLIANHLPALIAGIDRQGFFFFANEAHVDWFGRPTVMIVGHRLEDILGTLAWPAFCAPCERAAQGERVAFEAALPHVSLGTRQVEVDLVPEPSGDDGPYAFFMLLRDVTEQRRAERQLRRNERLAAIGTFAAGIAHEINNPIGAALLSTQAALRHLERGEMNFTRDGLENVQSSLRRCGEIVRNLLRFCRNEPLAKTEVDLLEVIRAALRTTEAYAAGKGTQLHFAPGKRTSLVVAGSFLELELVFVNLLRNAVEAGATNVTVRPVCNCDDRGRITVGIEDDGPGFAQEDAWQLCEPFVSTRQAEGGTGLGLSIAHGIVADHGGELRLGNANEAIDAAKRHGATVQVVLPLVQSD